MAASVTRFALALAALLPLVARAEVRLLEDDLRAPDLRTFALLTLQEQPSKDHPSDAKGSGGDTKKGETSGDAAKAKKDGAAAPSLDFDLLGEAKPPPPSPLDKSMGRRRTMLGVHQTVGLVALVPLQVATTVVGQLNYNDKFGDANTGKYKLPHQVLAYSTLAVFAANGALALLAPRAPPSVESHGLDRVKLHKICMFTAAAGMAAQAALGIYTAQREGYQDKQDFATAHLVVGYVTTAAVLAGVSAIIF